MEKKRCQVCGGPIANGRCKLCGMPYRKDEILYHLNEERSEHYKHASIKAREIMREEEVPLGDKMPKTGAGANNTVGRAGGNRNTAGNAYRSALRAGGKPNGYTPKRSAGGNRSYKSAGADKVSREARRKSKGNLTWLVFLVVVFLIPRLVEYTAQKRESSMYSWEDNGGDAQIYDGETTAENVQDYEVEYPDEEFWERTFTGDTMDVPENEKPFMTLTRNRTVPVGEVLPPGTYIVSIEDGYATVVVEHGLQRAEYALRVSDKADSCAVMVELKEGDALSMEQVDRNKRTLKIWADYQF